SVRCAHRSPSRSSLIRPGCWNSSLEAPAQNITRASNRRKLFFIMETITKLSGGNKAMHKGRLARVLSGREMCRGMMKITLYNLHGQVLSFSEFLIIKATTVYAVEGSCLVIQ